MYKLIDGEIYFVNDSGSQVEKLSLEDVVRDLNIHRDSLNDLKERIQRELK